MIKQQKRRLRRGPEAVLLLELGMLVFAAGLATGLGALLAGRAAGRARHTERRAESVPRRGAIPPERQRNIATPAAR